MWIIILGLIYLILFLFCIFILIPKNFFKKISLNPLFIIKKFLINRNSILIIIGVVIFHLIEVRYLDPIFSKWLGSEVTNTLVIRSIEGDLVYWFSQNWNIPLLAFFVIIYIGVYTFTLWFFPIFFILDGQKNALKSLAFGLFFIYSISLPFYLFMPITNVYTHYPDVTSALETIFPSIENFFYSTTTVNNCFPSLHTAMTILLAYCMSLTRYKRLSYFAYFVAACVIISVIYLSIHWIIDVIGGLILSIIVIFILNRFILKVENNAS